VPLTAEIRNTESTDRRGAVRRTLRLPINGRLSEGAVGAVIRDLSEYGFLLETTADLMLGERLHVELPEAGIREATVVWSHARFFGCEFKIPLTKTLVSATLLRAPAERSHASGVGVSGVGVPGSPDRRETEDSNGTLLVLIISLAILLFATLLFLSAIFLASAR